MASGTRTNVVFKRGLQKDLPSSATDGVFYLTTDTNRLYVGQGTSKKLLNQTVQIVPSIDSLRLISDNWDAEAKAAHINDFYYITGTGSNGNYSNILVVWTSVGEGANTTYEWRQINADHNTYITNTALSTTADSNVGTVTLTLTDNNESSTSGSFSIQGAGSVSVSSTSTGLVITGAEYGLTNKIDANATNSTDIYLTIDGVTATNNKVSLFAATGSNVTFQGTNAGIAIKAMDTVNESAEISVNEGSISIGVTDKNENSVTATVSNVGILLNDRSYVPITNTSTSGTTAGAIYSKAEIDNMVKGLDGMTYKGTLGPSGTATALPTTGIRNGDTYIVIQAGATSGSAIFSGANFNVGTNSVLNNPGTAIGDMVIASGTEGTDGYIANNLLWTYVPSGNDSLSAVSYTAVVDATNNRISLENGNETTIAQLGFVAGTDMALSSTMTTTGSTNDTLTTTINHASITTTTAAASSLSNGSSNFTAIKGITVNNGHVTAIETDTFTPVTYDLTGGVVVNGTRKNNNGDGNNVVTASIGLQNSNEVDMASATLDFSSESLVITKGGDSSTTSNEVIINLEWGSF